MAGAKALCFIFAAFVVLAPLMLTAQAPTSSASKAESTVSQAPDAAETNESAELAQKLTNPLAALISIPIQNWFDFISTRSQQGRLPLHDGRTTGLSRADFKRLEPAQLYHNPNCLSAKLLWANDPDWLERFDGKPFSFPGSYQVLHLGNRSNLPDSDGHQWTAQHAQAGFERESLAEAKLKAEREKQKPPKRTVQN
jgi:hypothetical protein